MRNAQDEPETVLVVSARTEATDGVVVLELRAADGSDLPEWEPGAHVDLLLTPDLSRQYSLCGDPRQRDTWRIGVLLEPEGRGGSRFVQEKLHVGVEVVARGPRNHFPLEPASRYVFVAGGIGITPIVPMVEAASRAGIPWTLLYGGRSRSTMAFLDEPALLGEHVTIAPQDTHGLLDLAGLLAEPSTGTLVYACGPEPLLDALAGHTAPWPDGTLHIERFTPKTLGDVTDATFEVELARSGVMVTVGPGVSILEAVTAAGIDAFSSCGEGTCGTCETVVLEGVPEHRDSLLTPKEQAANETMMICVSRAACPRLVLDM